MVSQCSCGLPITQVSNQPSLALLFHWKPFYEQFAASSMYKFQQEEHGGGGSRDLFHQQFLASQMWGGERTSLGSAEEFERGGEEWGGVGFVGGGMRGNDWRRMGLVRSSRRGVVEDNWTAEEGCFSDHSEVETPSGWSHQRNGELEMIKRDRGRNELLTEGELCWERASKRALGWEQSRRSASSPIRTVHNAPSTPWRVIHDIQYTARRTSDRRWPAFLSREKQLLAAEFRRLGIGACLAGTRGRLTIRIFCRINKVHIRGKQGSRQGGRT